MGREVGKGDPSSGRRVLQYKEVQGMHCTYQLEGLVASGPAPAAVHLGIQQVKQQHRACGCARNTEEVDFEHV